MLHFIESMRIREYLYRGYLNDGEKIQFVIHRHLLMQMKDFSRIIFFGLLLPLFAWLLFPQTLLFAAVWLSIGVIRFVYEFFDWYYDVWIVTDQSIVEVMWQGFFEKSSSRIEYHIIQGIGYEVKGFVRTVFNYGSITLDKFAGSPSVFDGAVNPRRKSEMLTAAQEEFVTNKNFRDHHTLQSILSDLVQHHVVKNGIPGVATEEEEEVEDFE